MREFKFRAWDKKYKQMYGPGDIRTALAFPDKDIEIMQYTGLKDKNGKEIYEGDVVRWTSFYADKPKREHVDRVEWVSSGFMLMPWVQELENSDMEVIGNRYENPELLEV